ncbi:MAG: cobalt transporter CbiM [Pseudomonadota bacterium]
MHIVDGALSTEVVATGAVLGIAAVAYGLKRMDIETMPRVAVLSAVFFVASLVHVPIGPSSVHLILNGLTGLMLGWAAFPALLIALLLQAVFFGFGGLTVLGINTINIALPGVLVWLAFGFMLNRVNGKWLWGIGFAAGSLAIALTSVFVGISLALSGQEFIPAAKLVFIAHLPVMVVEGILTAAALVLIKKVRPALLSPMQVAGSPA